MALVDREDDIAAGEQSISRRTSLGAVASSISIASSVM
jgi:hypothetical protein